MYSESTWPEESPNLQTSVFLQNFTKLEVFFVMQSGIKPDRKGKNVLMSDPD